MNRFANLLPLCSFPAGGFITRRSTDTLVVHCSATPNDQDIGVAELDTMHRESNGWDAVGYHFVIRRDGTLEMGRPLTAVGAHAYGINAASIGICLVGGANERALHWEDNFNPEQMACLDVLLKDLMARFPHANIKGHRDINGNKACPCFDVEKWMGRTNMIHSRLAEVPKATQADALNAICIHTAGPDELREVLQTLMHTLGLAAYRNPEKEDRHGGIWVDIKRAP